MLGGIVGDKPAPFAQALNRGGEAQVQLRLIAVQSADQGLIADAPAVPWAENAANQSGDLIHQGRIVKAEAIPLQHGELLSVQAAFLAGPIGWAKLVDGRRSSGQQALHVVFR